MDLSLGKFQDLLWMLVPESRTMIAEILREELDDAIEYDLHLNRSNNYALAFAVYDKLIRPVLANISEHRDLLIRCFVVIQRIIAEGNPAYDRDPVVMEILNRLDAAGQLETVNYLAPDLIALYRRMKSSW
ncbi:hypothetical protein BU204_29055 [Actinophytocola xanthii]|uniref:Uncharacterized protein n=2 Tax=Actinophytocola xanthii TaxID=1912961 RepID=A0A1Q8CDV6_9PSEU|nr:hypothetical protein BU204_29055 [Actinophytocola xanthii]